MFGQLELFQAAYGLARHATARQAKIAANIANVDTPGYRAQDIQPFEISFEQGRASDGLRMTRAGHQLGTAPSQLRIEALERPASDSPSGNTVSIETEMVEAAKVRQSHDMALTVYQSAIDIMRTSVRAGR